MRTLVAVVMALAAGGVAGAQESQDALAAKRESKIQAAFMKKAEWIADYDKARAESKKSGKAIFAYFTRSYAN